ncbi:MAG: hypothetical protein Fur002_22400 [Anaerolineales bacterium]
MIENYKSRPLWAKALAQYMEAPQGLSPQDFHVLRQNLFRRSRREETYD